MNSNTNTNQESFIVNANDEIHPAVAAAAAQVAHAEAALADRQRIANTKAVERNALEDRAAALNASRARIAARRAAGDARDGDAGEVALIDMDVAALAEPLAAAKAAQTGARAAVDEAARRVAFARDELAKAEDRVALDALLEHASEVCSVLADTLAEVGRLGQRVGALNFRWTPPATLMQQLRRAEIAGRPA